MAGQVGARAFPGYAKCTLRKGLWMYFGLHKAGSDRLEMRYLHDLAFFI